MAQLDAGAPRTSFRAAALFLLIAFAFSWLQWLAAMPSAQRWIGIRVPHTPFGSFALALLPYSFVMTWLVERSGGSALAAILFHTSANVTFWLAAVAIKSKTQDHAFWPAYLAALAVVGVASALAMWKRRLRQFASHDQRKSRKH